jgi:hypothetical protein
MKKEGKDEGESFSLSTKSPIRIFAPKKVKIALPRRDMLAWPDVMFNFRREKRQKHHSFLPTYIRRILPKEE